MCSKEESSGRSKTLDMIEAGHSLSGSFVPVMGLNGAQFDSPLAPQLASIFGSCSQTVTRPTRWRMVAGSPVRTVQLPQPTEMACSALS
jgi:hypothetical protein